MGSVERGSERVEMVHCPRRLEQIDVVGGTPDVEKISPWAVLRRCLDAECDHSQTVDQADAPGIGLHTSAPCVKFVELIATIWGVMAAM